jgi:hypothetical protein
VSDQDRVQLNVMVPAVLKLQVQHLALDKGTTMSDLVTEALQRYADQQSK